MAVQAWEQAFMDLAQSMLNEFGVTITLTPKDRPVDPVTGNPIGEADPSTTHIGVKTAGFLDREGYDLLNVEDDWFVVDGEIPLSRKNPEAFFLTFGGRKYDVKKIRPVEPGGNVIVTFIQGRASR